MTKTIVVTGASRGIGLAILKKFASEGWNIAFCSKNPESLEAAKNAIQSSNPKCTIFADVCDMSDKESVLSFGNKCIKAFETIDVLVNIAGFYTPGTISNDSYEDDLEGLMKTNLYSAYWLGKVIIPKMKRIKAGHIFTISSIAGMQAYPNGGSYAITKFALQGYIRTIREELKLDNIRVTGLYPGAVYTDSWQGTELPKSRFIASEDIADIIYSTYSLSPSAVVEDIVIRPQLGDI
jgi:NADP-dependent 3-hydroxy acid dehydrogenase YdfG